MADSFDAHPSLAAGGTEYEIFKLARFAGRSDLDRLPFSLEILLENLPRHEDGAAVTAGEVEAPAGWDPGTDPPPDTSETKT